MTNIEVHQFEFKGGLVLTPGSFAHRGSTITEPIATMPIPETLFFPLQHRKDEPSAEVCVAVGEEVKPGQSLTLSANPSLPPVLASCSGVITAINHDATTHPHSPGAPHIVLKTNHSHHEATTVIDPQLTLQEKIYAAGIRGMGGASFPSHLKFAQRESTPRSVKTLIINAAECEPLIQCDEALIREQAGAIIQAIHFLHKEIQSEQCLIGIEDDKPEAIAQLAAAMEKNPVDGIRLVVIPAKFPTGGERQLIKVLTNQEVPYRAHPASLGIVCLNVATALAIKQALVDHKPFSSRVVCVTGSALKKSLNVRVPIGTSIQELIEFVDPTIDHSVKITVGGPVSGVLLTDKHHPVTAACNCLLVEPDNQTPDLYQACIRCGDCDSVCPQSLVPQQLYWYSEAGNFAETERFKLNACIECGCCDLVCPSKIPLTAVFRNAKSDSNQQRLAAEFAQRSKERFEKREARLQQKKQQRQQRIQQRKAEIDAKKAADPKAAVKAALARAQHRKTTPAQKPDRDSSAT